MYEVVGLVRASAHRWWQVGGRRWWLTCCWPTYTKAQQKKWHMKKVPSISFTKRMSDLFVDDVMISSIASLNSPF